MSVVVFSYGTRPGGEGGRYRAETKIPPPVPPSKNLIQKSAMLDSCDPGVLRARGELVEFWGGVEWEEVGV
jgi:hypothetical protein